jgi:hypothetical protein
MQVRLRRSVQDAAKHLNGSWLKTASVATTVWDTESMSQPETLLACEHAIHPALFVRRRGIECGKGLGKSPEAPVAERTRSLFQKVDGAVPVGSSKAKKRGAQLSLGFVADLEEAEANGGWGETGVPQKGETVLDRVHQSMIFFPRRRTGRVSRLFSIRPA